MDTKIDSLIKKIQKDKETNKEMVEVFSMISFILNPAFKEEILELIQKYENKEAASKDYTKACSSCKDISINNQEEQYKLNNKSNQMNSIQSFLKIE